MSIPPDPVAHDHFSVPFSKDSLKGRSIRGSLIIGLGQIFKTVLSIGSQVILARLLFPADFGLIAMVYPVIAFIQVFNDLGFGQVIIQRPVLEQMRVSALFWANLTISCALALTVMLLSPTVAWLYGEPRVTGILVFLALILPVAALGIHPVALLTRQMEFEVLARNEVAASIIGVTVTVLAAWLGMSYWSLVLGQLCITIAGDTFGWMACKWRPSRPSRHGDAWTDLKFGGNITGANIASYITTSSDNIIIGAINGKVALGLYDRSYRLVVQPIGQMISPISRVALPLLSRLVESPDEYRTAYLRIVRVLILFTIPGMLVCIVNASTMINVLLGDRWVNAVPIFAWICVGGLTSALYTSLVWLFISQGRTGDMRNYLALASLLNLASYIIGAFWGIVAVAASAACVFVLITTPLVLFGATRSGPVRLGEIGAIIFTFATEGALVYMILLFQSSTSPLSGLSQIIAATFVAYGVFGLFTVVIPQERRAAHLIIKSVMPSFRI